MKPLKSITSQMGMIFVSMCIAMGMFLFMPWFSEEAQAGYTVFNVTEVTKFPNNDQLEYQITRITNTEDNSEKYVLTIKPAFNFGTSNSIYMGNFSTNGTPWKDYADKINEIVIDTNGTFNNAVVPNQNKLVSIGNYAFYNFSKLQTVTISGEGLIEIGEYAFYNCKNLTSATLPNSITTFKRKAFANCEKLELAELPSNTKYIQEEAFSTCRKLALTSLPNGVTVILNDAFSYCTSLRLVELPSSITKIGISAFYNCTNITLTSLPANVTTIGNKAFYGCKNITLTEIPSGVTKIDESTFYNCTNIAVTQIPSSVTFIGSKAFYGCPNITDLTFGGTSLTLKSNAFYVNEKTPITIHTNSNAFDAYNFANDNRDPVTIMSLPVSFSNDDLTYKIAQTGTEKQLIIDVVTSNSAKTIIMDDSSSALWADNSTDIDSIVINAKNGNAVLSNICKNAFAGFSNLQNIIINDDDCIISIDEGAFNGCENLELAELPSNITTIGNKAFNGCTKLSLTELPNGITNIGDYAFKGCLNLALSELPDGITQIRNYSFDGCVLLALSELPSGITNIGANAFQGCINLTLTLLPNGITSIGDGAFNNCANIALTELPSNIIRIGDTVFSSCTNLALTSLPDGVTYIGDYAFCNCTNLALTALPEGVTSIGEYAFSDCTNFTLASLPTNISNIQKRAFSGCSRITDLTYEGTNLILGTKVFYTNIDTPLTIHTDSAAFDDYDFAADNRVPAEGNASIIKRSAILADSVTLSQTSINTHYGDSSVQLTATVLPDETTDKTVTWESSDSNVATVSDDGLVAFVNVGNCTITATTKNGKNATCSVAVFPVQLQFATNPSGISATYSGSEVGLVDNAGAILNGYDGTIKYKLASASDDAYSTTTPVATHKGTYDLCAKIFSNTTNCTDSEVYEFTAYICTRNLENETITLTVSGTTEYQYTGSEITPAVIIKDGNDNPLELGQFDISYSGNVYPSVYGANKTSNGNQPRISVSVKNDADYEGFSDTVDFVITPVTVNVTADNASKTEDGVDPEFTVSASGYLAGDATIFTNEFAAENFVISRAEGEEPGDYAINVAVNENYANNGTSGYYYTCTPGTFTINAKPRYNIETAYKVVNDKDFIDKTCFADLTAIGGSYKEGVEVTLTAPSDVADIGPQLTFQGWYDVTGGADTLISNGTTTVVTATRNAKYEARYVNKYNTIPVAAQNLIYDGTSQNLLSSTGSVYDESDPLKYYIKTRPYGSNTVDDSLPIASAYTETIPAMTNAGTYDVWYKIASDAVDKAGKVTVTISPIEVTETIASFTKKENEEDPEFTYTWSGILDADKNKTDNLYERDAAFLATHKLGRDAGETAGTYEIKWVEKTPDGIVPSSVHTTAPNYVLNASSNGTLTINSIFNVVPTANTGLTYDGTEQALIIEGMLADSNDVVQYALVTLENAEDTPTIPAASTFTATIPFVTDSGYYAVYYKIESQGVSTAKLAGNTVIRVAPKEYSITIDNKSKYEGSEDPEYTYSFTGLAGNDTDPGFTLAQTDFVRETSEAVGEYEVSIDPDKALDTGNYVCTGVTTGKLTIIKLITQVPTLYASLTYDGTDQNAFIAGTVSDPADKLQYALVSLESAEDELTVPAADAFADAVPTVRNGGYYAAWYKPASKGASSARLVGDAVFQVKPRRYSIIIDNKSKYESAVNPTFTYLFAGLAENETAPDVVITQDTFEVQPGPNNDWFITVKESARSGLNSSNYTLDSISNGILTILPDPICTVSFDKGEGYGTMDDVRTGQTMNGIPPYKLPACGFTAPRQMMFGGWLNSADNKIYSAGDEVTLTTDTASFTATWKYKIVEIKGIDERYTYTGTAIKPIPAVYFGDDLLTTGIDYTVSYRNNINVGTATVVVTGRGVNYQQTVMKDFMIEPLSIAGSEFTAADIAVAGSKAAQKPAVVVMRNGKRLTARDFSIEWTNEKGQVNTGCVTPGTYNVKVTGKGNYTGERTVKFTVTSPAETLMSRVTVGRIANQTWTGNPIKPAIKLNIGRTILDPATDYDVIWPDDCTSAGIKTFTVVGKGAYVGSKTGTYTVVGIQMNRVTVDNLTCTYTGEELTPALNVYYKANAKAVPIPLVKDTDYTVTFTNNVKVGNMTATLTGLNHYSGTLRKTFRILPVSMKTDKAKFTITCPESVKFVKTGCVPAATVKFGDTVLKQNTDYTVRYTNNRALFTIGQGDAKKAPTVVITGKGNFKEAYEAIHFSITKGNIHDMDVTLPDVIYQNRANVVFAKPVVMEGKTRLAVNTDYTLRYVYTQNTTVKQMVKGKPVEVLRNVADTVDKNDIVPEYTQILVVMDGVKNYEGQATKRLRVIPTVKDISKAKVTVANQIYCGEPVILDRSDITITMNNVALTDADWAISSITNNTSAGRGSVVLKGLGQYGGYKTVPFTISKRNMAYTIVFVANGGAGTMRDYYIQTASGKLPKVTFTCRGKTFDHWSTNPDGTGDTYENMGIVNATGMKGRILKLYANWR